MENGKSNAEKSTSGMRVAIETELRPFDMMIQNLGIKTFKKFEHQDRWCK